MLAGLKPFAHHVAAHLATQSDPGYAWKFALRDPPEWVPHELRKGNTLDEASKLLALAGDRLRSAVAARDNREVCSAVQVIMDWGQVWYRRGLRNGNNQNVQALEKATVLANRLLANLQAVANRDFPSVTLMNAGWTKVFACANDDGRYIMYDSRVSSWFARRVLDYEASQQDQSRDLRFALRQTSSSGKRFIPGYPTCTNSSEKWAESMVNASTVVHEVIQLGAEDSQFRSAWFSQFSPRELEARLFTLGQ